MKSVISHLSLVSCWLVPAVVSAAVVSLPLGGYYREGKYMPVEVSGEGDVDGAGLISTRYQVGEKTAIVPVLVVRGPVAGLAMEMRMLGQGEKLVGAVGGDYESARQLFPAGIVVSLNLEDLARSEPAAWQTMDGLVMDEIGLDRAGREWVKQIMLAGTVVAVRSGRRPMDFGAWEKHGTYWIGRWDAVGPSGAVVNDAAYAPTYGWEPGWPGSVRAQIFILAAAIAIAMLATALVPARRVAVGEVAMVLIAGVVIWIFIRSHPDVFEAAGGVIVREGDWEQLDRWQYQACVAEREGAIRWEGLTWPMFASEQQVQKLGTELRCDANGRPMGFVYRLPEHGRVAFMSRSAARRAASRDAEGPSAMRGVAQSLYSEAGVSIIEQKADSQWGSVVLQKSRPMP